MDNATYSALLLVQQHMVEALEHARMAIGGISNLLNDLASQETKTVQKTDDELTMIVGGWWKDQCISDYTLVGQTDPRARLDVNKICKHMNQKLEEKYCTLRVLDVVWSDKDLYVWEVSGLNENGV
jgi:DNA-binding transcriptional regulator LsrR (DeoR family)